MITSAVRLREVRLAKNLKLGEILKQAGIIDDFQLNSALS
ncbi:MAG: hypothetical protein GTO60_17340, partial [Gammaproteobacteria bacterium]|nr:hypothetical protein [Gammaproteobacteria bacterium]